MELKSKNTHPDAQWFPKAGLGMFFHWGISSVDGMLDISWAMMRHTPYSPRFCTPEEYFALAKRFNPGRYDPNKWLSAAKDAGFRYAVLTTRHHDSYALWPSEYGEFNTRNYMDGRDLVGEYVDACRKNGLKVGFYFSPPDFYTTRNYNKFAYKENLGGWRDSVPPVPEPLKEYARAIGRGQIYELLTRYGKIDLIWFDGNGFEMMSEEEIRSLQPGIVIGRGTGTDFESLECELPDDKKYHEKLEGKWWELCHEGSQCWGYTVYDHWNIKPVETLINWFNIARKYNGNLLLNFGPDSEGDLTEMEYKRIAEFGEYVKAHPELMPEWDE